ncbi:MAG: PLP-dependent aminotransferase family protein [Phototrophicaceae bacterium]
MLPTPILYDLKTGYPHLDIVPREQMTEIATRLFTQDRPVQYVGDMRGDRWTREHLAAWMTRTVGQAVTIHDVQMSAGAIIATDQLCRFLTRPGDIVLTEDPTFYFIVDKLRLNHVQVMGVPMQPDGVDLDALDAICRQYPGKVTMFYAIPTFHNPTGYSYSVEKRRGLLELAHRHGFTIVEDATYQPLYYGEAPPPMIRALDPSSDRVISVGSFAKLLMPALRIGWIWATPQQVNDLLVYKTSTTSTFMSQLAGTFLAEGLFDAQLERVRGIYGRKHDLMMAALDQHAPSWLTWTKPHGGFFSWATLPEGMSATDALAAANACGVDFAEGRRAFVQPDDAPDNAMRLCFALLEDEAITRGVTQFAEALHTLHA